MKIFVKAKPGASEDKIEQIDSTHFVVFVKAPPVKGSANLAVAKVLAEHFKVPRSNVQMFSGFKSHQKVFEII